MNPDCFKATYQADEVWFTLDGSYRESLPSNSIVYTLEEAELLAEKSDCTRRIVHQANKRGAKPVLPLQQLNGKERDCADTIT
jgi:hypothetical protein